MFKSCLVSALGIITVIDDDFIDRIGAIGNPHSLNSSLNAIVRAYEERNINPIPNVWRYFQTLARDSRRYSISEWINHHRTSRINNDLWKEFESKYEVQLDKYLVLL